MSKLKKSLFIGISSLLLLSACNKEVTEVKKETTSKTDNVISQTTKEIKNKLSPEVQESQKLIENYLLAFNETSREDFLEKITPLFKDGNAIYYYKDYDYGQLRDVTSISFDNSDLETKDNQKTLKSSVTLDIIDAEDTPREITLFVVANMENEELTDIYFYEDENDYENPTYTMYSFITKNQPPVMFGDSPYVGNLDVDAYADYKENLDEVLASYARQSILKYHALYLETNPKEYNRKVNNLYHSSVKDNFLVSEESNDMINGNLIEISVTNIDLEFINRTSDGGFTYEGNYSFSYIDTEGHITNFNDIITATFSSDNDNSIKLMSVNY